MHQISVILAFVIVTCAPVRIAQAQTYDNSANPLFVSPAELDFSQNPPLLERVLSGPHGYFRFINIRFGREVCNRFRDILPNTPSFNLHGDAHIEQYAVTDLGRGLTDFDDSATGPGFLDIMRFGVSIQLACIEQNWQTHSESLFDTFLEAYLGALQNPDYEFPEPEVVARIRSRFKHDRSLYFQWVESLLDPMPEEEQAELKEALEPYFATMMLEQPELKRVFFTVENLGYLRLGIGSALDLKYLVRLRGESDDPLDDVVLEIKEVRDISGIDCLDRPLKSDPFRVLLGQARIAYRPFKFLGYMRMHGDAFWIHSWVDNYKEVKIGKTFQNIEEMRQVVFDVGFQLGQGHPKQIAAPLDIQLRREQLRLLTKHEARIKQTRLELADLTVQAWQQFCAESSRTEGP